MQDDKIIHQEGKFKYLEMYVSGYWDVEVEVRNQVARAMRATVQFGGTNTYGPKPKLESTRLQLDPY